MNVNGENSMSLFFFFWRENICPTAWSNSSLSVGLCQSPIE